ncbi:MAG TPA: hypothetical protein VHN14_05650 [Kofleriaceae bacterium]|jgi:hypothetical protein|nr:hypothetical protein [Kofleriaceae bacterium]
MKKTATRKKKGAAKNAKSQKSVARDIKIITEDDLVVVVGGVNFGANIADQI